MPLANGIDGMRRRKLKAGERSFIKNVAIFMGGRSVASAVTFLLTPVISRLYFPEHFGMAAVFLATTAIVGSASCAGYEKAINVTRQIEDASKLLRLCLVLSVTVAIVASPLIVAMSFTGAIPKTLYALGPLLWLLPIAIALEGLNSAAAAWLLRHKQYKSLAAAEVLQTSIRSGTRVTAGLAVGSTVSALLWSYVIGFAAKLWLVQSAISKVAPTGRLLPSSADIKELPALARRYSDFPRYNLVTSFMMQLTDQLPIFVLGAAFGAEIVGFMAMADRVMRAPINITSNTLRQVALQKLSEIWHAGRSIRRPLTQILVVLFVLGLVPYLMLYTFGEELFAFVLGDRWQTAGRYIEIMVPYFMVAFLGAPFQAATAAMRRQRLWFWLELVTAVARLAIIPVAAMDGATPELVLRVYVWTTVTTKLLAFAVVYWRVPRVHPGFGSA